MGYCGGSSREPVHITEEVVKDRPDTNFEDVDILIAAVPGDMKIYMDGGHRKIR